MPQPGSLAQQALDWWQQRYAAAAQHMQAQENPLLPWQDSLASQRWQMEQALLQLYLEPDGAAQRLAQLADDTLRDDVHARWAGLPPPNIVWTPAVTTARISIAPGVLLISLPPPATACASSVSLPGCSSATPAPLKRSPRLVLAGIMLVMLALTACGAAYRWLTPNPPHLLAQEAVYDHPVLAAQTIRLWNRLSAGTIG